MDLKEIDIEKFAEKLVRAGPEEVAWEQRKLAWIREERAKEEKSIQEKSKSEAV